MEVTGYCTIKKEACTGKGTELETFFGKDCRVLEFASDGGVLVVNQEATAVASFDKSDVVRKFECSLHGIVILPPGLDEFQKMDYTGKVLFRKGGYNNLLKNMVIQASLAKGVFTDSFLWAKQD